MTLAAPCCHPAVSMLLYAPLMRRAERLFQIIQILRRSKRPVTAAASSRVLEPIHLRLHCPLKCRPRFASLLVGT